MKNSIDTLTAIGSPSQPDSECKPVAALLGAASGIATVVISALNSITNRDRRALRDQAMDRTHWPSNLAICIVAAGAGTAATAATLRALASGPRPRATRQRAVKARRSR
jgi:hypothetical protein